VSLDHFEEIYQKLGTKFDYYFFESETGPLGKQIVHEHVNGVFEKSDGAVVFRGEKHGLHTRVFLTSEELPTYEAKDLGLVVMKADTYPSDLYITITASEQTDYFRVVKKALELMYPDLAEKVVHIAHGMMRLSGGKMSSRTGDVVTAETLLNSVIERVNEKMKDTSMPDVNTVSEHIAVGAIKYSILKQSAGKDIVFDFEKSLSFEGDSGPYLMYSHARARSVLEKARAEGISPDTSGKKPAVSEVKRPAVSEVERLLYRFPEVVERAMKEYEPHYVATFLTELAGSFNSYYAKEKIIDGSPEAPYKLALTDAFAETMKNGLWLLGIEAPEKM
jgi:arginyl-tRNA synthetase